MVTPFQQVKSRLGVGAGLGFNYTPTNLQQTQTQNPGVDPTQQFGQDFLGKLNARKRTGQDFYNNYKQSKTTGLASKILDQSAGLKFDQFGKPNINLANFGDSGQAALKSISQSGQLATQAAEAKRVYQNAVDVQNLGQYNLVGNFTVTGTDVPGANSDNIGGKAVSMALQVLKNGTPYVWGGNSLSKGIDCSGLIQQIYGQLGVSLPRTTFEQAKTGHVVSVGEIRPGDLVFYGSDHHHAGIYAGNGKVIHAANPKIGVVESNLSNSNGAPTLIVRPY